MNKKLFTLFIFWWALIFPNIAYNDFTTDIILENNTNSKYIFSNSRNTSEQIVEYDFWFKRLISPSS